MGFILNGVRSGFPLGVLAVVERVDERPLKNVADVGYVCVLLEQLQTAQLWFQLYVSCYRRFNRWEANRYEIYFNVFLCELDLYLAECGI